MKRVKYFDEENPMKLEREINEFLSETNVSFVDIKFQSEKAVKVMVKRFSIQFF